MKNTKNNQMKTNTPKSQKTTINTKKSETKEPRIQKKPQKHKI